MTPPRRQSPACRSPLSKAPSAAASVSQYNALLLKSPQNNGNLDVVPPGILTSKTLQTILISEKNTAQHSERPSSRDAESSAKPLRYGEDRIVCTRKAPPKPKKRHVKLAPMHDCNPKPTDMQRSSPTRKVDSNQHVSKLGILSLVAFQQASDHLRNDLAKQTQEQIAINDRVGREIQWIQANFPILQLASTKCSRQLRQQLFAKTITDHFRRGQIRLAWKQWHHVVLDAKRTAMLQLHASRTIVELFASACQNVVAHWFWQWKDQMMASQQLEQEAAAVTIQGAFRYRLAMKDAATQRTQKLVSMLEHSAQQAIKIQRAYQTFVAMRRLRASIVAIQRIQRGARRRLARKTRVEAQQQQHAAASVIQTLCHQLYQDRQVESLYVSYQVRTIQRAWRSFVTRCRSTIALCICDIISCIEWHHASMVIQRHVRGFLCRLALHHQHSQAHRVQRAWQRYRLVQSIKRKRIQTYWVQCYAIIHFHMLGRRAVERLRLQQMMHKSTQPLFLRCHDMSSTDRLEFYSSIQSSAASVMQSTWRRYQRNQRQRHEEYIRQKAKQIQDVWRRYRRITQWQHTYTAVYTRHHDHQLLHRTKSARRIQQWWKQERENRCIIRIQEPLHPHPLLPRSTLSAEDIPLPPEPAVEQAKFSVRMWTPDLTTRQQATMILQRWYHCHISTRYGKWHDVVHQVLSTLLPTAKRAVQTIGRAWQRYYTKQNALQRIERIEEDDTQSRMTSLMDLHMLKEIATARAKQQEHQHYAARRIQKAWRRVLAKREGVVLLRRYKILRKQELELQVKRNVIHQYLRERQAVRASKQQAKATMSMTKTMTPTKNTRDKPAQEEEEEGVKAPWTKYWSDEHHAHYFYNPETGESRWDL